MHCEIIDRHFNVFFCWNITEKENLKNFFGREGLGTQTSIPVSKTAWIRRY